jgi:hypothetical protein
MERLPRHSGNMQPGEYDRPRPFNLTAPRHSQYQQHVPDPRLQYQPQTIAIPPQVQCHSTAAPSFRPNFGNDHSYSYPLSGQSQRQNLRQVKVNGVEAYHQSHVPLQKLPSMGPPTHQFACIEPTLLLAYYIHPGRGYVPFVQPVLPVQHHGNYERGYNWAPMQPHHRYHDGSIVAMDSTVHAVNASFPSTSVILTYASRPHFQYTSPLPNGYRMPHAYH